MHDINQRERKNKFGLGQRERERGVSSFYWFYSTYDET
jgi:hypothetical protein